MEGHVETAKGGPRAPLIHQDFLFVDATQAKTSRQGRKNVRSFVMQKARRDRPWSTSKHAAKRRKDDSGSTRISQRSADTPNLLLTPKETTSSPTLVSDQREHLASPEYILVQEKVCSECQVSLCGQGQATCPRCVLLNPAPCLENIEIHSFDPFGTSSVDIDASVLELLEHFTSEMAPSVIALDFRRRSTLMMSQWFGAAISNVGFMHSLLSTAALHLYMSGRGSIETIIYHRARAISAINAAISSEDVNSKVSDANIGAVFNLLTVEESLQSPAFAQHRLDEEHSNQRAIHESGLEKMVQLRGGLISMSSNRVLQAFILWHSTAWAVAELRAPEPSTLHYIKTGSFPRHPFGYQANISQHLLDSCRHARVKEPLINLVEEVLILIADLNVWFGDLTNQLDPLDIQNYSCVLECKSLTWLHEADQFITPLEKALCLSLLIFAVRTTEALQQRDSIHLVHLAANQQLEQALNRTIRNDWQFASDLLLWILSIGAISANGSPESN